LLRRSGRGGDRHQDARESGGTSAHAHRTWRLCVRTGQRRAHGIFS
jgi:hypothetical protein